MQQIHDRVKKIFEQRIATLKETFWVGAHLENEMFTTKVKHKVKLVRCKL